VRVFAVKLGATIIKHRISCFLNLMCFLLNQEIGVGQEETTQQDVNFVDENVLIG